MRLAWITIWPVFASSNRKKSEGAFLLSCHFKVQNGYLHSEVGMRISSPTGKFICFVQNTVGFRFRETLRGVQNWVGCKPANCCRSSSARRGHSSDRFALEPATQPLLKMQCVIHYFLRGWDRMTLPRNRCKARWIDANHRL